MIGLLDVARLEGLRAHPLSDTTPHTQQTLDRLARAVADTCEAPGAMISLIGAFSQRFVGAIGLPEPWATSRCTDLEHSFCQHVVTSGAPVLISDARTDPRITAQAGAASIQDLGIVAYAGVPLVADGLVLGSVCAVDHRPREWSSRNVSQLREIAEAVMDEASLVQRRRDLVGALRPSPGAVRHPDAPSAGGVPDPLTGWPTRPQALALLEDAVQGGHRMAVFVIAPDHIDDINDGLGHEAGDQALSTLCHRLREASPPEAIMGRLGGVELLVAVPATAMPTVALGEAGTSQSSAAATDLAARLLTAVRPPVIVSLPGLGFSELEVTASIGIALAPEHGREASTLLARAHAALRRAKAAGGACSVVHQATHDRPTRRLSVSTRLRRAITGGELEVHYQPVVELSTGRTVSFEALSRWHDAQLGAVSPEEFIPVAQECGLIGALTDLVLERSLAAAVSWNRAGAPGRTHPLVKVAVNITPQQLQDPGLPARIAAAISASGLPPAAVVIEVTESAAFGEDDVSRRVLRELHGTGVDMAIDDFGVGYSNLARLRDLAADATVTTLKLDRSFIADLPQPPAVALVSAFTHCAHVLGLEVLAEGIETAEQRESARSLGIELGQGWLFSAALPAPAVSGWLDPTGLGGSRRAEDLSHPHP